MRTASRQFECFTRETAIAYLASAPPMAENHGDRIAAWRALSPRSSTAERETAQLYAGAAAAERASLIAAGVWPATGPIRSGGLPRG